MVATRCVFLLCSMLLNGVAVQSAQAAAGVLNFDPRYVTVGEGSGSATVTVTRSGGSAGAISVAYSNLFRNGTATVDADFQSVPDGILSWDDGDSTSRSVSITILDDDTFEITEHLRMALSSPTGGALLGSDSEAIVEILDDDPNLVGLLTFEPRSLSVSESAGSASLTVIRSGGDDGAISVDYRNLVGNGTATPGSDFAAIPDGTLSWASGDSSARTITVTIVDDESFEISEHLRLALSNPTGGALVGDTGEVLLEIVDDDPNTAGVLNFVPASIEVGESAGVVALTVSRSGGTLGAVSVDYTNAVQNGTATPDSDYVALASGSLAWEDGDTTSRTISVTLLDDQVPEITEHLRVRLGNPTGGALVGADPDGLIYIADNDLPALSIADVQVIESDRDAVVANLVVSLQPTAPQSVSVDFATADGSALAPSDYVSHSGTLSFAPGTASATISVNVQGDFALESDETFVVNLAAAINASINDPQGVATIVNDEGSLVFLNGFEGAP